MPRSTTRIVSLDDLRQMFADREVWQRIHDGRLTSFARLATRAPSRGQYQGGTSIILIHLDPSDDAVVCSTHQICDPNGNVLHWDESTLHEAGLVYVKDESP